MKDSYKLRESIREALSVNIKHFEDHSVTFEFNVELERFTFDGICSLYSDMNFDFQFYNIIRTDCSKVCGISYLNLDKVLKTIKTEVGVYIIRSITDVRGKTTNNLDN